MTSKSKQVGIKHQHLQDPCGTNVEVEVLRTEEPQNCHQEFGDVRTDYSENSRKTGKGFVDSSFQVASRGLSESLKLLEVV